MEFSKLCKQNGSLKQNTISWSPCGKYYAYMSNKTDLIISLINFLPPNIKTIAKCRNQNSVDFFNQSGNSKYIMCVEKKANRLEVQAINIHSKNVDFKNNKAVAVIDEGLAGLDFARQSPDGEHILTSSSFEIRLTIQSLNDCSISYIEYPKFSDRAIDFSHDHKFLAVAERKKFRDYVGIYYTKTQDHVKTFQVDCENLYDLKQNPDDSTLCIQDSYINYKFLIYSRNGRKLHEYIAYKNALGIKSVNQSISGNILSIGSYDERLRVFQARTWEILGELDHSTTFIDSNNPISDVTQQFYSDIKNDTQFIQKSNSSTPIIFKEIEYFTIDSEFQNTIISNDKNLFRKTKYVIESLPYKIGGLKLNSLQAESSGDLNIKVSVDIVCQSNDDRWIATRNENMPSIIQIWDTTCLSLHSLILQINTVKSMHWDKFSSRLFFCCADNNFYFQTQLGCSIINLPFSEFAVQKFETNPNDQSVILIDKANYCLMVLNS